MWQSPKHVPSEQARGGAMARSLVAETDHILSMRSPRPVHLARTPARDTAASQGVAKQATLLVASPKHMRSVRTPAAGLALSLARHQVTSLRLNRHYQAAASASSRYLRTCASHCAGAASQKTSFCYCSPLPSAVARSTERDLRA